MNTMTVTRHTLTSSLPETASSKHTAHNPFRLERPGLFAATHPCPGLRPVVHRVPSHDPDDCEADVSFISESEQKIGRCMSESEPTKETVVMPPVVSRSDPDILLSETLPYQSEMTDEIEFNFNSIKSMPEPTERSNSFPSKVSLLPTTKKTLVLDLDETLVHTLWVTPPTVQSNYRAIEFCPKTDDESDPVIIYVAVRPFAKEMLRELSRLFDIIVLSFLLILF